MFNKRFANEVTLDFDVRKIRFVFRDERGTIEREFPEIKIIAISGGGSGGPDLYLDLAEKFGVRRAFTKPLEVTKLLEAARELLAEP